jgi:hypothetical protein
MMHEINKTNSEMFNDTILYHYFRRFKKELPFSFDKYLKEEKKRRGEHFLQRGKALKEMFMSFPVEIKEEIVNYYVYKFHQHKVSRRSLYELEDYLDNNKEELFKR